ncbi:hypothetical protein SRIMM317S_05417 [Streptomyces rimosus subsp. rimosus]
MRGGRVEAALVTSAHHHPRAVVEQPPRGRQATPLLPPVISATVFAANRSGRAVRPFRVAHGPIVTRWPGGGARTAVRDRAGSSARTRPVTRRTKDAAGAAPPWRRGTAPAIEDEMTREDQKSMSPPGMPPGAPAAAAFSGFSAMTVSVVRSRAAIDAAFSSAERVTLAGSMTPAFDQVAVLAGGGVEARGSTARSRHLRGDDVALQAGVLGDPLQRGLDDGAADDGGTGGLVTLLAERPRRPWRRAAGRATAGDDALLDRGAGRGDGVLQTVLASP